MTLAQLRYAITVANSNSMNEAARNLFISQPSLSSAIRELEEEIGVELFRRTNRGISVTPEGEEFLGYARQVVEQYELIESKYVSKEHTKKKFSVSMQHYTFAVNAFVEMVKQFGMDEYEFAVHETRTYDIITDVKDFKSEIGILYLNDFNHKVLEKLFHEFNLEFHPILECSIYVYMWKGHPLADRDLMRALIGAREAVLGENVIDIRGRAMQALETRLDRLESTHESVISTAYENQTGMNTVHRAVLSLLEPMDFEGFLENLETTVAPILRVETLRLVMETGGTLPEPESSGPLVIVPEGTIAELISGGRRMPRGDDIVLRRAASQTQAFLTPSVAVGSA